MSKNKPTSNSDNILDLDALSNESGAQKGYFNKKRNSISLNELQELNKKPVAELTASEKLIRDSSNQDFSQAIKKAFSGFTLPSFEQPKINFAVPKVIPQPSLAEQQKQTELLIKIAEQSEEKTKDIKMALQPRFYIKTSTLYFANTPIPIKNHEQFLFCKKLFTAGNPVKHPVEIGDFYDVLDTSGLDRKQKKKKVYNLKSSLNDLITKMTPTTINDLFVIVDRKVWFNKKYL